MIWSKGWIFNQLCEEMEINSFKRNGFHINNQKPSEAKLLQVMTIQQ